MKYKMTDICGNCGHPYGSHQKTGNHCMDLGRGVALKTKWKYGGPDRLEYRQLESELAAAREEIAQIKKISEAAGFEEYRFLIQHLTTEIARLKAQPARIVDVEKLKDAVLTGDRWFDGEHNIVMSVGNIFKIIDSLAIPAPDYMGALSNRPLIVCLCGSTRFYETWQEQNFIETMKGRIVLSVGFYPHCADKAHAAHVGVTEEQKIALDELHKRKIDLADEIFVLNVGGYIGESTRSEIEYAKAHGKPIRYLEKVHALANPTKEGS